MCAHDWKPKPGTNFLGRGSRTKACERRPQTVTDGSPNRSVYEAVGPWECTIIVRVDVRMPCQADFPAATAPLSHVQRRVRPRRVVGAHPWETGWLCDTGPRGRPVASPLNTEAQPHIGAELLL